MTISIPYTDLLSLEAASSKPYVSWNGHADYTDGRISYSFDSSMPTWYIPSFLEDIGYEPNTETQISMSMQSVAKQLLDDVSSASYRVSFSDVSNIKFEDVTQGGSEGSIMLMMAEKDSTNTSLAFAQAFKPNESDWNYYGGDIWFDKSNTPVFSSLNPGQIGHLTIMHELGHSLGLVGDGGLSNIPAYDNQKYTIMSYNGHSGSVALPSGLQIMDILAVQELYGKNYSMRSGDTEYALGKGFGATSSDAFIYTIWDGAGVDEISADGYSQPALIDLRQGSFSSIGSNGANGAAIDNVAISFYTIIENATGTNISGASDVLIGNAWNNTLRGLAGDDVLYGDGVVANGDAGFIDVDSTRGWNQTDNIQYAVDLSGEDVLDGGAGKDQAYGGAGDDTFIAYGLTTGLEGDLYFGGSSTSTNLDGTDTVDYSSLGAYGIHVDLNQGFAQGWLNGSIFGNASNNDTLQSIESIIGTGLDDKFVANHTTGATFDGGLGIDEIDFSTSSIAIQNLQLNSFITNIEKVTLTNSDDTLLDLNIASYNGLTLNGANGTDTLDINGAMIFDQADNRIYDIQGRDYIEAHDFEVITGGNIASNVLVVDQAQMASGFSPASFRNYDYSAISENIDYTFNLNYALEHDINTSGELDGWLLDYALNASVTAGAQTQSGTIFTNQTQSGGSGLNVTNEINPQTQSTFTGGNEDSTYTFNISGDTDINHNGLNSYLNVKTGTGNDTITINNTRTSASHAVDLKLEDVIELSYTGGLDTVSNAQAIGQINIAPQFRLDDPQTTYAFSAGTLTLNFASGNSLTLSGYDDTDIISVDFADGTLTRSSTGFSTNNSNVALTFEGTWGNDVIALGDEGYSVNAYGGADTITTGAGNDFLRGGAGSDTYHFLGGVDTVDDSADGGKIDMNTFKFTDLTSIEDVGNDVRIVFEDGVTEVNVIGGANSINSYRLDNMDYDLVGLRAELLLVTQYGDASANLIEGTQVSNNLHGNGGDDEIYAFAGDDNLYGGLGNDSLHGGSGNDFLNGGSGYDSYFYSSGVDTVAYDNDGGELTLSNHFIGDIDLIEDGVDLRIVIENGVDEITLDDYFLSSNRIDKIEFADGFVLDLTNISDSNIWVDAPFFDYDDTLTANDAYVILGGSASNVYKGDLGDDIIFAGGGNDDLVFNGGNDVMIGGDGNDYLYVEDYFPPGGDLGSVSMFGGAGNDLFEDYFGMDTTYHDGDGQDQIYDVFGNDTYYLRADGDTDTVYDDDGNDTLIVTGSITDWVFTQNGNDLVIKSAATNLDEMTFKNHFTYAPIENIIDGDGISYTEADLFYPVAQDDIFTVELGSTLNANLLVDNGNGMDSDPQGEALTVTPKTGNSSVTGSYTITANGDITYTPSTDFVLSGYTTSYILSDASGNSSTGSITFQIVAPSNGLVGTGAANDITGTASDDAIFGSTGNDILRGGAGDDEIFGGRDDDLLYGGLGADLLDGGSGYDTISYSANATGVTVNLKEGWADDNGDGTADDTILNIEKIKGSAFSDLIIGGDNDDYLTGFEGNDEIHGGLGDDVIVGGNSAYNDGFASNDKLYGDEGTDSIRGSHGDDELYGGADGDILYGGWGLDILDGGTGKDQISYAAHENAVNVNLTTGTTDKGGTGTHTDTLISIETVRGSDFDDTLTSSSAINNVKLLGGEGNDTIIGMDQSDRIYGEEGLDILTGGLGDDTFFWLNPDLDGSVDRVTDFNTSEGDRLNLSDVLDFSTGDDITEFIQFSDDGTDTTLSIDTDGATGGSDFEAIAILEGSTGFDANDMLLNGQLVVE